MTTTPRYARLFIVGVLIALTLYSEARAETYLTAYNITLNPYSLAGYDAYGRATAFSLALALASLVWVFAPQKRGNN